MPLTTGRGSANAGRTRPPRFAAQRTEPTPIRGTQAGTQLALETA